LAGFQSDLDTIQSAEKIYRNALEERHSGRIERVFFAQQCADLADFSSIIELANLSILFDSPRSLIALHRLKRVLNNYCNELREFAIILDGIGQQVDVSDIFSQLRGICAQLRFELDFLLETMGEKSTSDGTPEKNSSVPLIKIS
jgi:hypothetical protein